MIFNRVLWYNSIKIHQSFLLVSSVTAPFWENDFRKKKKKELVRVFLHFGATLKRRQKRSRCKNTTLCNRVATDSPKGSLSWCLMLSRAGRVGGQHCREFPTAHQQWRYLDQCCSDPWSMISAEGCQRAFCSNCRAGRTQARRVELAERSGTSWADRESPSAGKRDAWLERREMWWKEPENKQ